MSCFNFLTGLCISAASARAGAARVSTPHFFTGELRIRTAYTELCDDIELDILEARVKESCMENGVVAGGYLNKGCARFFTVRADCVSRYQQNPQAASSNALDCTVLVDLES
jgi:hypothetical protein